MRPIALFHVPRSIREISASLASRGRKTFIVGGVLRDFFLGKKPANDYDLASDASPEEIMALFPRVIPTGIRHGTVTILMRGNSFEMTTLRTEGAYSDGRHPDSVTFVGDIRSDLSRRDFTMNAMAYELPSGELHDPFDGRADIRAGIIRTVGSPKDRFAEDGLRPLRAIRFAAQLEFRIDPETMLALKDSVVSLRQVSRERIRDEFSKLMLSGRPSIGLRLLEDSGALDIIDPRLREGRGCEQKGFHAFDVLDHAFRAVDAAICELPVRLAALFHDSGKPQTRQIDQSGMAIFYRHEEVSARIAEEALRELKYPNELIAAVDHLVRSHMFHYTEDWTDAAVRRFVARVGIEALPSLFALRRADSAAIVGGVPDPERLDAFTDRISEVLSKTTALGIADLKVDGNDLASIGVPRDRRMGAMLKELLDTVIEDPLQNEKENLLNIARGIKAKYGIA